MEWLTIANSWRDRSRGLAHGQIEAAMAGFGATWGLTPVSVRRAAAALRFAEQLVQADVISAVADVATIRLETLDKLKRMHGYGLSGLDAVRDALPRIREGLLNGAELRQLESRFRRAEAARAPRRTGNSLELRLRTPAFRAAGLSLLRYHAGTDGSELRVLNPGSKALTPLSLDALAVAPDGRTKAYRLLPATGSGRESRLSDAILLALAGARAFDAFEIVAQESRDGSLLAAKALELGSEAGVGISWMAPGPKAELVRKVVPGPRRTGPDLRHLYADRIASILSDEADAGL